MCTCAKQHCADSGQKIMHHIHYLPLVFVPHLQSSVQGEVGFWFVLSQCCTNQVETLAKDLSSGLLSLCCLNL